MAFLCFEQHNLYFKRGLQPSHKVNFSSPSSDWKQSIPGVWRTNWSIFKFSGGGSESQSTLTGWWKLIRIVSAPPPTHTYFVSKARGMANSSTIDIPNTLYRGKYCWPIYNTIQYNIQNNILYEDKLQHNNNTNIFFEGKKTNNQNNIL